LLEVIPPAPMVRCVLATLLLSAKPAPVNWMALTLKLPTLLTLSLWAKPTSLVMSKRMVALVSASGVPPWPQLAWVDQLEVTAPIQVCEAGVRRSSSSSNAGRREERFFLFVGRRLAEGVVADIARRSQGIQVNGLMILLLFRLCGEDVVCVTMGAAV